MWDANASVHAHVPWKCIEVASAACAETLWLKPLSSQIFTIKCHFDAMDVIGKKDRAGLVQAVLVLHGLGELGTISCQHSSRALHSSGFPARNRKTMRTLSQSIEHLAAQMDPNGTCIHAHAKNDACPGSTVNLPFQLLTTSLIQSDRPRSDFLPQDRLRTTS